MFLVIWYTKQTGVTGCMKNIHSNKEINSHLNAEEAKYMTTAHMMWKNWRLIAFSTPATNSEDHTSAVAVLLSP
jgi:hypothetical protein